MHFKHYSISKTLSEYSYNYFHELNLIFMSSNQVHVPNTIIYKHDGTEDSFIRQEPLGHGSFGIVFRATYTKTNEDYAIKVLPKDRYEGPKNEKRLEKLKREFNIQKKLNHPNIVKAYYMFSDKYNYYILLEYCPGGTIRDLIKDNKNPYLNEQETRKILIDVVNGVIYLHKNHIIHRDLKLTNYMIGSDGKVKLADFGLSNLLKKDDEKRYTICGTPAYTSPELLQDINEGYGYEVDVWAIGVSAFTMLTGHHPFEGKKKSITFENIKNCDYDFPQNIKISLNAKDFIMTIFKVDPKWRPSAAELMKHPFLTSIDDKTTQSNIPNQVRPREILDQEFKKDFMIPKFLLSEYLFHEKDLCYILLDGTVGICFEDKSRIIMDPNEKFIQYYKNYNSYPKLIDLDAYLNKTNQIKKVKFNRKIKLVKKIAKKLKKTKSFELQDENYDSSVPLHHVKYFLNKDGSFIFRFNDKNTQVNFVDDEKLIIFTDNKKMCLVKNMTDECKLLSLEKVSKMPENCNEHKKLLVAQELLSELSKN